MIYITGDTHIPADIHKLNTSRFPKQKELTEKDVLIICGDFGGVWDDGNEDIYWRKWLDGRNFTTLFVDGNHENFDLLGKYPVTSLYGGNVHKIGEKIYHLMRGQVFDIDGTRIFTFGGAASHDKQYRKEGISWWREELPSEDEMKAAVSKLESVDMNVDLVITHCAPGVIQNIIADRYERNILTDFFDTLMGSLSYKKWFFGHYHVDRRIDEKHTALFDKVILFEN